MIITARQKLSEKNIHWKEKYTPTTHRYKRMYGDIIGKNSYFRWEGRDLESDGEYFVVVGPAKIRSPMAAWFAGCRKLPSEWAAGGQYFPTIKDALEYAHDTWGTPLKSDLERSYDASDLKGIRKKVDVWREINKDIHEIKKSQFLLDEFYKYAKGGPRRKEKLEGALWFTKEQVLGGDTQFQELMQNTPHMAKAYQIFLKEYNSRRNFITKTYGLEYLDSNFYQIFMAYKPDIGTYLISVGPYCAEYFQQAFDKFGLYVRVLNVATQEEIDAKLNEMIQDYINLYGVKLFPEDIKYDEVSDTYSLNKDGRTKVKSSDKFKSNFNYYEVKYGIKNHSQAKKKYLEELEQYKKQKSAFDIAYKQKQQTGEVLAFDIPPPPRIDLIQKHRGNVRMSTIYKEAIPQDEKNKATTEELMLKYGFDSLHEALSFAMENLSSDFPAENLLNTPNVTTEDLKNAREKTDVTQEKEKEKKDDVITEPSFLIKDKSEDKLEPNKDLGEQISRPIKEDKKPDVPKTILEPKDDKPKSNDDDWFDKIIGQNDKDVMAKTILNLVKLAKTLDNEHKPNDAEEVHKILRKYINFI